MWFHSQHVSLHAICVTDMDAHSSFTVKAMVREYHVYKDNWDAEIHEQLPCQRECTNIMDPFVVTIGPNCWTHSKISSVCSFFLDKNGSIICHAIDHTRPLQDLPQGGLEIPVL